MKVLDLLYSHQLLTWQNIVRSNIILNLNTIPQFTTELHKWQVYNTANILIHFNGQILLILTLHTITITLKVTHEWIFFRACTKSYFTKMHNWLCKIIAIPYHTIVSNPHVGKQFWCCNHFGRPCISYVNVICPMFRSRYICFMYFEVSSTCVRWWAPPPPPERVMSLYTSYTSYTQYMLNTLQGRPKWLQHQNYFQICRFEAILWYAMQIILHIQLCILVK